MKITSQFIEHTSKTIAESEKEEHITCTFEERSAALERLYQNIHSKDEIKKTLGRKYKANIVDLFTLCNSLKYMYFNPETVMPLSTTGALSETFGNQVKASRVIDMACKIGLLEEVNGKYSYCSASTKSIHFKPNAKEYVCNRKIIEVIEEICKEEEIIKENRNTNISIYNNTVAFTFVLTLEDLYGNKDIEIKYADIACKDNKDIYNNTVANTFASNLDYKITSKTLIDDTDENVLSGLYNHYWYIRDFQALVDEINEKENLNPIEQIKFRFKITRGDSGKVTKIGCRATNGAVSFKEHENKNKNYKGTWRKDYLKSQLGEYEEYDVHSSISNVTYLLNHGTWLGIDCYDKEFGRAWDKTATRDWYKSIFMRLYFNATDEATAKAIIQDVDYRHKSETMDIIHNLKQNVTNFIGKQYGSEIFLHESCIYLLVRKELMNRGIKCVQIYDGFYFKKGEMPEDMEQIVKNCAEYYYTNYFRGEKKMDIDPEALRKFVIVQKATDPEIPCTDEKIKAEAAAILKEMKEKEKQVKEAKSEDYRNMYRKVSKYKKTHTEPKASWTDEEKELFYKIGGE